MSETVKTTPDGVDLPLDSLAQSFTWDGSFISTITVVYAGNTYKQSFTNDGTNITGVSGWVKQ